MLSDYILYYILIYIIYLSSISNNRTTRIILKDFKLALSIWLFAIIIVRKKKEILLLYDKGRLSYQDQLGVVVVDQYDHHDVLFFVFVPWNHSFRYKYPKYFHDVLNFDAQFVQVPPVVHVVYHRMLVAWLH